jgi:hypothetical protein
MHELNGTLQVKSGCFRYEMRATVPLYAMQRLSAWELRGCLRHVPPRLRQLGAGRDVVDVRRRKLLAAENKKCLVHSQQLAFVFVVDETQFPEPVHKEANS